MKTATILTALTVACTASALAGGSARNVNVSLPGDALPAPAPTDEQVQVRRASAVMDPHDQVRSSQGSLWKDGISNEAGMCADRKGRHRGDILTIVVSENTTVTNTLSQTTSKGNSIDNPVLDSYLLNLPRSLGFAKQAPAVAASAAGGSTTGAASTGVSISGALGLTANYTGQAQLNQQAALTARTAVTVTDVLPNGNLVIEGTRILTFAGETKYAQFSGVVRGDDVGADDTVQSSSVADAKVQFYSEGALTDGQKKGWLSRGIDKFNPL